MEEHMKRLKSFIAELNVNKMGMFLTGRMLSEVSLHMSDIGLTSIAI